MNREIIRWFGTACLLILLLAFIVPVRAEPNFRPTQGDLCAVGSVIDVSGVMGFGEGFAYYGYSGDTESDPIYVMEMSGRKSDYYNFYLDPAIFGTRLGPWYQFVGNNTGVEHGNLLAFRVVKELPKTNVTNVTPTPTTTVIPQTQLVEPKKFDTDYQIAYGDLLSLPVNTKLAPPRLWVFGRIDKVYNKSFQKQVAFLTAAEVQNLEVGTYTILTQFPGKNTIFEVGYSKTVDVQNSKTAEQLTSPWVAVKPITIYGIQPRDVMIKFREMIKGTDDVLVEYRLEVAHPVIDISQIDETYAEGKDVLDVRGYTNVAKGTLMEFVFDKDQQTERTLQANTYMATVQGDVSNQWRYFQVLIPIDYETIPVGQHEITATAPQGASQTVPFYVYDMPKGQETPNETIKYVSGNQFLEKPTAEIITVVQTVIQTQTIYVPVTPNDEQVYIAQKKASDANWRYWLMNGALITIVGVVVSMSSWYLWGVVKRARKLK